MIRVIIVLSCLWLGSSPFSLNAQSTESDFDELLDGYWAGSYIRGNAAQQVEAEFHRENDSLRVRWRMPEWIYYGWTQWQEFNKDSAGYYHTKAHLGDIRARVDTPHAVILGTVDHGMPAMYIHLKKRLRPLEPELPEPIAFETKAAGATIAGSLQLPAGEGPFPCIVYAGGRGYQSRNYGTKKRGEFFARQGIAWAAYDEIGAGESTGDFMAGTMDRRGKTCAAVIETLRERDNLKTIGIYGTSAGGWVAQNATGQLADNPDFIITLVGPATSVYKQQRDCAEFYFKEVMDVPQSYLPEALEYLEMTFRNTEDTPEATYERMKELLASAEQSGWKRVLAPSDIPESAEKMDELWCRNFAYDPKEDLAECTMPYLAFFGEKDAIVPDETNAEVLRKRLRAAGNEHFEVVVLPLTGHNDEYPRGMNSIEEQEGNWNTQLTTFYNFNVVEARIYGRILELVRDTAAQ